MIELNIKQDGNILLDGNLTFQESTDFYHKILSIIEKSSKNKIILDLSSVHKIDSAGVATLDEIASLAEKQGKPLILNKVTGPIQETITTFSSRGKLFPSYEKRTNFFEKIGDGIYQIYYSARDFLYLTADVFYWSFVDLFNSKGRREDSVVSQSILIGVNALPIIALMSFLVGFVLALQSAAQLRQFGANIFVADLIAISMTREMGPLMTAVLLAGRSGSSFASEIATMKVTEELDALKVMALNPIRFVVVPKFYAITLCAPLLTILSDVIGIIGGFVIGITYLQISPQAFINEVIKVMILKDIITSLVKSIVFAWIIVLIGSFFGFRASGGAEGVGRVTTSSVVASIFMVIVADCILGLIFYFGK
ncbi:MAG: ABC transporter [Candidatus Cloacimonadota bacterium]|nr:MAG: ABC transporter [Candidatus Cloacimonadota bacterium]